MIGFNPATSRYDLITPMEQLTSGKRINQTADDAAGAAIVQTLTTQIRSSDIGYRNANDGIGLIQTADGAMEGYASGLQRMRELALQSANGTLNAAQRQTLQAEFDQIRQELTRTAESTDFNGRKLLNQNQQLKIQVGDSSATIDLRDMRPQTLGLDTLDISNAANALNTLHTLDSTLKTVADTRAQFGAQQNSLTSAAVNLQTKRYNEMVTRSQINDADIAKAFAELSRNKILQQAKVAMMSQANTSEKNVLNLLN
jgi:flagellin